MNLEVTLAKYLEQEGVANILFNINIQARLKLYYLETEQQWAYTHLGQIIATTGYALHLFHHKIAFSLPFVTGG